MPVRKATELKDRYPDGLKQAELPKEEEQTKATYGM